MERISVQNEMVHDISTLTLVIDRLPSKMSVYKDDGNYFLVKDNEYKGHIEYLKKGSVITIIESHSELKKGFYSVMFTAILSDVDEILSDIDLSSQAIKAYENLNRRISTFSLVVKIGPKYKEFSKETLLSTRNSKVSIRYKHSITEDLKNYYWKIDNAYSYKNGYELDNGIAEFLLYHEGWDSI